MRHSLKRKDYSAVYQAGKKFNTDIFKAFYLPSNEIKIGYVASRMVGNAVARNRAKRLLREAVRSAVKNQGGAAFVFIARKEILKTKKEAVEKRVFATLKAFKLYE